MISEADGPAVAQLAIALAAPVAPGDAQIQQAIDLLEETRLAIADRLNQANAQAVAAEAASPEGIAAQAAKDAAAAVDLEGEPAPLPPVELKQ